MTEADRDHREALLGQFGGARIDGRALKAYLDGPRRQIIPTEWTKHAREIAGHLVSIVILEVAPGARGGGGWRVSPAIVEERRIREERSQRLNEPHRSVATALASPYAKTRLIAARREVSYGWLPDGVAPKRDVARRVPKHPRLVCGTMLVAEWRHASELAEAMGRIDKAIAERCRRRAEALEDLVTQLKEFAGRCA